MAIDKYSSAQGIYKLLAIFGWLCVVIGVVLLLQGLITSNTFARVARVPFVGRILAVTPGLVLILNGLFVVAYTRTSRASIDVAENDP